MGGQAVQCGRVGDPPGAVGLGGPDGRAARPVRSPPLRGWLRWSWRGQSRWSWPQPGGHAASRGGVGGGGVTIISMMWRAGRSQGRPPLCTGRVGRAPLAEHLVAVPLAGASRHGATNGDAQGECASPTGSAPPRQAVGGAVVEGWNGACTWMVASGPTHGEWQRRHHPSGWACSC